jgi:putative hemolysin
VREIMTPRTDIDWIDLRCSREEIRAELAATPHSRLPVAEGSADHIVGVVSTRDMLAALLDGEEIDLAKLMRPAPVIPDLMDAMDALAVLRSAEVPLALVHDEYGHLDGIVTPGSLLAALAGAFANDMDEGEDPPCVEREDGSWLVSGAASADLLSDRLGVAMPEDRDYSTVAGFALWVLKRIPETGETFAFDNFKFEIVDMDGRKIDKLLVKRRSRKRSDHSADAGSAG